MHSEDNDTPSEENSDDDNDEDSNLNENDDVNLDIMIDKKAVTIKDFPQIGGQNAAAYGDVMMPSKLYATKRNIQTFIESKMVDDWKVTKKWMAWLKQVDLKTVIKKREFSHLSMQNWNHRRRLWTTKVYCRFHSVLQIRFSVITMERKKRERHIEQ